MKTARITALGILVASFFVVHAPAVAAPKPSYDPALYQAMKYRSIGPYRGGRVTAVSGVPSQADTVAWSALPRQIIEMTNQTESGISATAVSRCIHQ